MRRFAALLLGASLLVGSFSGGDAIAATIVARDVAYLTQASDLVLYGTVQQVRNVVDSEGRAWTHNGLQVHEAWKGEATGTVEVVQLGGTLPDGRVHRIEGDLTLEPGDRVVIFLQRDGDRLFSTLLAWSVFEVGPQLRLSRHHSDFGLLTFDAAGRLTPSNQGDHDAPTDLIDLRTRVRKALGVK
jgi:hypothetical protein